MPEVRKQGGKLQSSAAVDVQSVNAEARTFDVVFATETPVFRAPWWSDESFNEVLAIDGNSIRTARLDTGGLPLLDNHNQFSGIAAQMGRVVNYSIDPAKKEARATIQFSSQERFAGTFKDIQDGIVRNISVGYRVWKYDRMVQNPQDTKEVPTYRAVDWEPLEISLVAVPADPNSSVRSEGEEKFEVEILNYNKRSGMNEDLKLQIRQAVASAGLPESFAEELIGRGITMDVATTEISARKAQTTPSPQAMPVATPAATGATGEEGARAAEAERERAKGIRSAVRAAKLDEKFADELIERKVDNKIITLDQARAAIIDKMAETNDTNIAGKSGASVRSVDTRDTMEPMIEALMERAVPGSVRQFYNLKNADGSASQFAGRGLSEAAKEVRHLSMVDMCGAILEKKGQSARGLSGTEIVTRAMATTDLADLFTSTTQRFLRNWYESYVPEWEKFSRKVNANDFRVKTGVKADAAVTFEELAENGEYKVSSLMSDEKATLQLKTFARKFSIGRKVIINDDLDILSRLPKMIALGARQFQSKKVWGLVTGNVAAPDGNALFHTAKHSNLASAGALISSTTLSAGRTAMQRQKSPQGNELMITPKFLVVPPEQQTLAEQTIHTITPNQTSQVNIWQFLEPMTNVYFTDTTAWYLVADPNMSMVDGLVHSYLDGQEGLFTESYISKDNDALVIKARQDFDAQVWGWQGWYKNPGA